MFVWPETLRDQKHMLATKRDNVNECQLHFTHWEKWGCVSSNSCYTQAVVSYHFTANY